MKAEHDQPMNKGNPVDSLNSRTRSWWILRAVQRSRQRFITIPNTSNFAKTKSTARL